MSDVTLTVNGYESDRVEHRVAELLAASVEKEMVERIKEAALRAVDTEIRERTAARVAAEVEAIVTEGWQKTDHYGQPNGQRVTLRARVNEYLTGREEYGGGLKIDKMAQKAIDDQVRKELEPSIANLKAKFVAMVDDVLKAKIGQALRDAVGLR